MTPDPIAHLLAVCRALVAGEASLQERELPEALDAAEAVYRAAPEAIVKAVLADITDRRGFSQAWDEVPRDIRKQIRNDLQVAVMDALRGVEDT